MWTDNSASPNGVNPESRNGEATVPSPTGSVGNPPGNGVPAAGVFTTCHACTTARVSRSVTCQGCHKTFHWACMGFYEHKYQRPGPNWRCKDCKVAEPPSPDCKVPEPPSPDSKVAEPPSPDSEVAETPSPAAAGRRSASPAAPVEEGQSPESEEAIDVGDETHMSTTLPKLMPQVAAVQSDTAGGVAAIWAAPAAVGTSAGLVTVPAGSPARVTAPAVTVPSPMGEHICPICKKGLGRFRTVECSVCHMPSHAGCVNIRGAETPKSWVCRDCKPGAQATAGMGPRGATAAVHPRPSVAASTVSPFFSLAKG